jgi:ubiquinone/menaquinone biosynthesis C-methylase UbiE
VGAAKTMRGDQSSPSPPDARASGSGYDAAAHRFDLLRPLPDGATLGIRLAVIRAVGSVTRPHLLDLGAGAGRIGRTFVAAGDDYLGVDLSFSMLGAFQRSSPHRTPWPARLVQADGRTLPFRDATFDAVMMMQVFGGMSAWPAVLTETRRVLRSSGVLILGRTLTPQDGVDAILKRRLASMLSDLGFDEGHNFRRDVERALESTARSAECVVAASWQVASTARQFLERRQTGARFSALPQSIKEDVLRRLGAWAVTAIGSLDAAHSERHAFELKVYRFD